MALQEYAHSSTVYAINSLSSCTGSANWLLIITIGQKSNNLRHTERAQHMHHHRIHMNYTYTFPAASTHLKSLKISYQVSQDKAPVFTAKLPVVKFEFLKTSQYLLTLRSNVFPTSPWISLLPVCFRINFEIVLNAFSALDYILNDHVLKSHFRTSY